jgi:hypothetical protein
MAGIKDLPKVEAVLTVGGAKFAVLNLHKYREFIQKIALTGKIEEADYVQKYPDVAEAIREKKVASATDHYVRWGYLEKRAATLAPDAPVNGSGEHGVGKGTMLGQHKLATEPRR